MSNFSLFPNPGLHTDTPCRCSPAADQRLLLPCRDSLLPFLMLLPPMRGPLDFMEREREEIKILIVQTYIYLKTLYTELDYMESIMLLIRVPKWTKQRECSPNFVNC